MLLGVALVRIDVSEELSASIIRVTRITLLMEALQSSETTVLTRATRHNIPEDSSRRDFTRFHIPFCIFLASIPLFRLQILFHLLLTYNTFTYYSTVE
jgi:hypothetical protein